MDWDTVGEAVGLRTGVDAEHGLEATLLRVEAILMEVVGPVVAGRVLVPMAA